MCESHREIPREKTKRLPSSPVAEEFQSPKLTPPESWTEGMQFLKQLVTSAVRDESEVSEGIRDRWTAKSIAEIAQAVNMEGIPKEEQAVIRMGAEVGARVQAILGEDQPLPEFLKTTMH
jgi:hypothetical protein